MSDAPPIAADEPTPSTIAECLEDLDALADTVDRLPIARYHFEQLLPTVRRFRGLLASIAVLEPHAAGAPPTPTTETPQP